MKQDTNSLSKEEQERKRKLWYAIEEHCFNNHEPAPSSMGKTIDDYTLAELEKYVKDNNISVK